MIRYSAITVLLLLAAFLLQQFLPAFTGLYHSRILLVQLVFLCCAVTVSQPVMLLLAFIAGFLWDAQYALGPHGGDPATYTQQVENLRFGYSILLFGGMGFLMLGIQPLFRQGYWQLSAALSGVSIFLYLIAEYSIICFVRGGFFISRPTLLMILFSSLLTMLFSPFLFRALDRIADFFGHSLQPEINRRRRRPS